MMAVIWSSEKVWCAHNGLTYLCSLAVHALCTHWVSIGATVMRIEVFLTMQGGTKPIFAWFSSCSRPPPNYYCQHPSLQKKHRIWPWARIKSKLILRIRKWKKNQINGIWMLYGHRTNNKWRKTFSFHTARLIKAIVQCTLHTVWE